MDVLLIILGVIFLLAGLIGCFLPVVPGPPLAYIALIALQFTDESPFTTKFLIIGAIIVAIITVVDYIIPPITTKRFGGSRSGIIGSTLGIIAGIFFFPPLGIIIFPFVGAFVGELINGREHYKALRAAFGSFIGFISGVLLKLVVTIVIGYYFFTNL